MAKPSRGATRIAPAKKKAKKRYEPQIDRVASTGTVPAESAAGEAVAAAQPTGAVLQFRPRQAEAARAAAARGSVASRTALQAVDYSYVYADLKLIGALSVLLFGGLVALSFVIH
jgi:hypothetical protein